MPFTSSVLPGLRWAFLSETDNQYRYVGFVEMCSNIANDEEIYDKMGDKGK